MNRRGFFAALLAPLVVPFARLDKYFGPTYFWPVEWKGRVDLEDMYEGQWLVVDGQARRITKYKGTTKRIALQARCNTLMNQMVDV